MVLVANTQTEHMERIVRLLTHPGVQELGFQFILGLERWTPGMFNLHPRSNVSDIDSMSSDFCSYIGVAHTSHDEVAQSFTRGGLASIIRKLQRLEQGRRPAASALAVDRLTVHHQRSKGKLLKFLSYRG